MGKHYFSSPKALLAAIAFWSICLSGCATTPQNRQPASEAPPPEGTPNVVRGSSQKGEPANKNTEASAEYHFSMAQAYVAEGNPDRAIEEYKLTLLYDPKSPLVYTRLATEYVKKGALASAMEMCRAALKEDPKHIDARLLLGGLYSTTHESQAAVEEYDQILKINPGHEEAMIYKSQVLLEAGKPEDAAKDLLRFTQKNPESALGWYAYARSQQRLAQPKKAVSAFLRALEIRPGFTQAAMALGMVYEEQGLNELAVKTYQALFNENQEVAAASRIATIMLKEEKYKEALPYLESIRSSDPDDMNVRVKLGLVQMELKQNEKAVTTFKEILSKNPESDRVHYYLGSVYEEMKKQDEAITELKLIQPESKLFGDAAVHAAFLLKQAGRVADAKTFITESIKKDPKIPNFYIFQATLEEEGRNLEAAIKTLETGVKLFPDNEKLRYYLGSLFDRKGDYDRAIEHMEHILGVNSENVDALNYVGYTWTLQGTRLNDAEKLIKRALSLRPNNGYIQDSWGWYLFTRGKVPEAIVELEKAVKLKPTEPTILEHLGDAYIRSNLRQKAYEQYREAVRYIEDGEAKKKIENKLENLKSELVRGGHGPSSNSRMPASEPTARADQKLPESP